MNSTQLKHKDMMGDMNRHNVVLENYIELEDDKRIYGSKRINLIRISQEKKVKKLELIILNWTSKFENTTHSDRLNWRSHYQSIQQMKKHLSSGLNHTLSKTELILCNELYSRYSF
jgi:hypothetical protein